MHMTKVNKVLNIIGVWNEKKKNYFKANFSADAGINYGIMYRLGYSFT